MTTKIITMAITILVIFLAMPVNSNTINVVIDDVINDIITTNTTVNNITLATPVNNVTTPDYTYLLNQKGQLLDYYPENSCELIAKTYQREYGGQLIFIAPYNTLDNRWIRGAYAGHWSNLIHINGTHIYIDYGMYEIFENENDAITFFNNMMRNKFDNANINVKFFVYGEDTMPYPMIYYT